MSEASNARAALRSDIPTREFCAELMLPVLQDVLARQGRFVLLLRGNSMRPTLPEECEIEVIPRAGAPRLGQLIVFAVGDVLVAHRFVARKDGLWIAQGDNRRGPDPPLPPEQVLGMVAAVRVQGHRVWPRRGERVRAWLWVARYHILRAARWGRQKLLR